MAKLIAECEKHFQTKAFYEVFGLRHGAPICDGKISY